MQFLTAYELASLSTKTWYNEKARLKEGELLGKPSYSHCRSEMYARFLCNQVSLYAGVIPIREKDTKLFCSRKK